MTYQDRADRLAETMTRQLRAKGNGLEAVARYAGRRLPKRLHRDVDTICEASRMSGHPKLRHRIDDRAVTKAERRLNAFLGDQNPRGEKMNEFLDRLAAVAFVICVTALALFFWMLSTGRL